MTKQEITKEEKISKIYEKIDSDNKIESIIGHPIMIGDVLDWIRKSCIQGFQYNRPGGVPTIILHEPMVLNYRKELREPIENQSDECLELIYSLVTK